MNFRDDKQRNSVIPLFSLSISWRKIVTWVTQRNSGAGLDVADAMRAFEDHFSSRATVYAQYRPAYPKELYAYLASLAPHHRFAWDCGTGNGQAALGLSDYFDHVVATDASNEQLAHAPQNPRVEYKAARAEESGLTGASAALVTSAVAIHWFDLDRFYAEVRRVLVPGGIIAAWCYSLPSTAEAIDAILKRLFHETLAGYWPERFHYVKEQYTTLPFPFQELAAPPFTMKTTWSLEQVLGFINSWSGATNYEKREGRSLVHLIEPEIARAWGSTSERTLTWQIFLRVGRVD